MEYNINIDRKSFQPAYLQLVNIIRGKIDMGHFLPGERLPSESQLCQSYDVSPMTVRRAVNILIKDGIVTTTQGKGTFVKPIELSSVKFSLNELLDIFSNKTANKVKLLEVRILKADADVSGKLNVKQNDKLILIRRLILKDDVPTFYHQEYLIYDPKSPIVESEMEVTALYGLFSGRGTARFKRGELAIKASALNEKEADILLADKALPSFRIEHRFYNFENKPVSWGYFTCRGDQINFKTTVGLGGKPDIKLEKK